MDTACFTVYADWQARRERLAASQDPADRVQVQLLDYLLDRYAGTRVASRPANRSSIGTSGVNERAIVVHHHTEGVGRGVASTDEAESRIVSTLARFQKNSTSTFGDDDDEEEDVRRRVSGKLWNGILRKLRWGFNADSLMEKALRESPYLPGTALQHLYRRNELKQDVRERPKPPDQRAMDLLLRCENRSVYDLVARAWRERVVAGVDDEYRSRLEAFLLDPTNRQEKLLRVRRELPDDRHVVRSRALKLLARIGTVDDIGLLSDLLAIPPQPDEEATERQELLATMQALADSQSLEAGDVE